MMTVLMVLWTTSSSEAYQTGVVRDKYGNATNYIRTTGTRNGIITDKHGNVERRYKKIGNVIYIYDKYGNYIGSYRK